ncbi:MAG: hypothetical protein ACJASV_003145 [Pseudorhodobacter sp.]|jgi:hypothetical protein
MRFSPPLFLTLTLVLVGCQTLPGPRTALDLRSEVVAKTSATPPPGPETSCWASDVTPAIIETRTEQALVEPETRAEDGTVISSAVFRTTTQQIIIRDRTEVWFRAPCPDAVTLEFVATLQRALKARGLYTAPLTGQLDAPTRRAIRQYQEPLGLDSEQLSLAAARNLGIVAGEF